ncbi:hypothetical protein [uncultured Helcococcus sp.]|uniref:hypothetical protein n=1 Tax=uncultured Helcococcus sp. TaxID=1072508 RepID=UPI002637ED7B|nr:hypothetical protein [uncultured Helcococcus sp.]
MLKKNKILLLLLSLLLLVSCSKKDNRDNDKLNIINKPEVALGIQGIWEKVYEYNIADEKTLENIEAEELFISKEVVNFKDSYILDPKINSRLVNYDLYMKNKITNPPKEIGQSDVMIKVYELSNNVAISQEFILLPDSRLLTIYLGNISIYDKKSEVSKSVAQEKYEQVKGMITGNQGANDRKFALAISFRQRDTAVSNFTKHNYYTYYMKKNKDDESPDVLKVRDIVLPKTTDLWTVEQEILDNRDGSFNHQKLTANPTFSEENKKTNSIQDNLYRRIDYVDKDYIAVTNFDHSKSNISESYNIFDIQELSKKSPLQISEIAGPNGVEIYQTTFKENANLIFTSQDLNSIDLKADLSRVGLQRIRNGWKFISGIDQEISSTSGNRIYRKFDLNITPIINIAKTQATKLTWRDILERRPNAIDATISPENDFVLIQSRDTLELYPIYYNFISSNPLFTIHNTEDYEIVMAEWIGDKNIDDIYNEFSKLPQVNNHIVYE